MSYPAVGSDNSSTTRGVLRSRGLMAYTLMVAVTVRVIREVYNRFMISYLLIPVHGELRSRWKQDFVYMHYYIDTGQYFTCFRNTISCDDSTSEWKRPVSFFKSIVDRLTLRDNKTKFCEISKLK